MPTRTQSERDDLSLAWPSPDKASHEQPERIVWRSRLDRPGKRGVTIWGYLRESGTPRWSGVEAAVKCRECISVLPSLTCCLIFSHAPKADVAVAVFAVRIVRTEVRIVLDQPVDMVGLVLIETHECLVGSRKPTLLSYGVVVSRGVLLRFFLQVSVRPYPHQAGTAEGTHASCVGPSFQGPRRLRRAPVLQTPRTPGMLPL